ncbi:hypothetical protein ACFX19_034411 [Malus domestica]
MLAEQVGKSTTPTLLPDSLATFKVTSASTFFPLPSKPRTPLWFLRKGVQRHREEVPGTVQEILPSTNCS